MPLTLLEAKRRVAHSGAGENDADALEFAKIAIADACRRWSVRHNWDFRLVVDQALSLVLGENEITIEGLRRVSSITVDGTNHPPLEFKHHRHLQRSNNLQGASGEPKQYTVYLSHGANTIRVYPAADAAYTLLISYYGSIEIPGNDEDFINVPDDYIDGILTLAKYLYLLDDDTKADRREAYKRDSEQMLQESVRDDRRSPDHISKFIPQTDYSTAHQVRDPSDPDLFI